MMTDRKKKRMVPSPFFAIVSPDTVEGFDKSNFIIVYHPSGATGIYDSAILKLISPGILSNRRVNSINDHENIFPRLYFSG